MRFCVSLAEIHLTLIFFATHHNSSNYYGCSVCVWNKRLCELICDLSHQQTQKKETCTVNESLTHSLTAAKPKARWNRPTQFSNSPLFTFSHWILSHYLRKCSILVCDSWNVIVAVDFCFVLFRFVTFISVINLYKMLKSNSNRWKLWQNNILMFGGIWIWIQIQIRSMAIRIMEY